MGVELSSWVETIRKYPLSYKFEGLDGFHQSVSEACRRSSTFVERSMEEEADFIESQLSG